MAYKKKQYGPGKNPNSLKAQHHFKKGAEWEVSGGNAKGRNSKEKSITEALRVLLTKGTLKDIKHTGSETIVQALAKNWIKQAFQNARYFEMMLERIEGRMPQSIIGEDGKPVGIKVTVVSENARQLTERITAGEGTTAANYDEAKRISQPPSAKAASLSLPNPTEDG